MIEDSAGRQPGDPARPATAIITALDAPQTPLRLGDDAVDGILAHLDSVRAELSAWAKLSRDTGWPADPGARPGVRLARRPDQAGAPGPGRSGSAG
jgi:hypothetical protein